MIYMVLQKVIFLSSTKQRINSISKQNKKEGQSKYRNPSFTWNQVKKRRILRPEN